jgi:hypothetical protein
VNPIQIRASFVVGKIAAYGFKTALGGRPLLDGVVLAE